jgi:beta-lactamase class A
MRGSRRLFVASVGASLAIAQTRLRGALPNAPTAQVAELEGEIGGRIGLAALNTADGRQLSHRADERFAMCSTFKLMLAAAILSRVDAGSLRLGAAVPFRRSDLVANSPVTAAHASAGALPLSIMLKAVIEVSDNTAANQLLELIGGPTGYTAYLRGIGDAITRLDRVEVALNSNLPGDVRDTTSPRSMLEDMQRVLVGDLLSESSRGQLVRWMRDCQTGHDRLRARLPAGWEAGDKTGTGSNGASNDLAILLPPRQAAILVACYLTGSSASMEVLNAAHARIGALVASALR